MTAKTDAVAEALAAVDDQSDYRLEALDLLERLADAGWTVEPVATTWRNPAYYWPTWPTSPYITYSGTVLGNVTTKGGDTDAAS